MNNQAHVLFGCGLEVLIPELVGRALHEAGQEISHYDAILVDEGRISI
jgi:hypothetical protein